MKAQAAAIWQRASTSKGARSAALLASANYGSALLGLCQSILAARLLGPADLGVVSAAIAFPMLVWGIVSVKSITITTRYAARYHGERDEARLLGAVRAGLLVDLGVMLTGVVAVAVLLPWVSASRTAMLLAYVYALHLPFLVLDGTSLAVLNALERFRALAVVTVVQSVVALAGTVLVLALGWGMYGYVAALVVPLVLTSLLNAGLAARALHSAGYRRWRESSLNAVRDLWREALHLLGWSYLISTMGSLIALLPPMLLVRTSPEGAAYFRIAVTLMTAAAFPMAALSRVLFPKLCRDLSEPAPVTARRLLREATGRAGLPLFAVMAVGLFLLPVLVEWSYGPAYSPMVQGLQWLVAAVAVEALFFWLQPHFYARAHMRAYATAYAVQAVAVGLAYVLGATDYTLMAQAFAAGRVLNVALLLWFALRTPRGPAA